jgi:hypothetical protein
MKPGSKVVASHDIGAVRGKATSNPNLDPELINKRFEEAETESAVKKQTLYSVPKELKGLENLIFLGANTRDVVLGEFTFTLTTISAREQEVIFKKALEIIEQERVLFFKKGEPTKKIWYYQLKPGRNMGKTNPLNDKDLEEFIELQKSSKESDLSWSIDTSLINKDTWELSVKNPNINDEVIHKNPEDLIKELEEIDQQNNEILRRIKSLL